jgi:hypothetical protein
MTKKKSSAIDSLSPEKIAEKLENFGRSKKEEDGKIIEDEDDEKTEL